MNVCWRRLLQIMFQSEIMYSQEENSRLWSWLIQFPDWFRVCLHNDVSAEFESFQDNLLEYPQYSRPEEWHGKKVPAILLSGHHANIEKWRREQSILRTKERRPDLFEKCELTKKEKKWLEEVEAQKQK